MRASRFCNVREDSLALQAQTERSRTANLAENRIKLANELRRIYKETIPGETSKETVEKHEVL